MKYISLLLLAACILSAKTYTLQPAPKRDQLPHQTTVELKVGVDTENRKKVSAKQKSKKTPKFRWHTDMDKALHEATELKRPILLVFTAADSSNECPKLEQEVLSQQAFKTYVSKHFIPCKMDFSNTLSSIPKEEQEKRQKIRSQYRVNKYPAVLLLDAEGKVLARTGYVEGGAPKYIQHLKELKKK